MSTALLVPVFVVLLTTIAQSDETAKSFHLLPHLADGGGWQSALLTTNVSQSASRCTFNVYGIPINRFDNISGVTAAGSTATFQLEGNGGYVIWPTLGAAALESGYATLDCSAPVTAQVVFASLSNLGAVTGMATVFSSQAATVFQFPVMRPEATLGFAIANNTNATASCRIVLEDTQRANQGETTVSVPAKSNRVQMLNLAIAVPETFLGGSAVVECNQQVAMIGLHFVLRPDRTIVTFATLPPAILSTSTNEVVSPPVSSRQSFGAGTWIVNEDIAPGRYFTNPARGCYWERLSATTGASSDILANEVISFDASQEIVDILNSDYAFKPDSDCGTWSQTPVRSPSSGTIPPGRWLVGSQVAAGEYEVNASRGCYWERLRSFGNNTRSVIANDFVSGGGRQIVTIRSSDVGFYGDAECGTWTRRGSRQSFSTQTAPAVTPSTIERNRQLYREKTVLQNRIQ